jgi:large subunit ribosomal protein L13
MLDEGPLARQQFSNLRVYKGAAHPHEAQQPVTIDIASMNRKNVRSA